MYTRLASNPAKLGTPGLQHLPARGAASMATAHLLIDIHNIIIFYILYVYILYIDGRTAVAAILSARWCWQHQEQTWRCHHQEANCSHARWQPSCLPVGVGSTKNKLGAATTKRQTVHMPGAAYLLGVHMPELIKIYIYIYIHIHSSYYVY